VVNVGLHVDCSDARTVRAAKGIVPNPVKVHGEANTANRKLVVLARANGLGAIAINAERGRALVCEMGAFFREPAVVRGMAMLGQASEILHCWPAAALGLLVEAVFTRLGIVEVASLTTLVDKHRRGSTGSGSGGRCIGATKRGKGGCAGSWIKYTCWRLWLDRNRGGGDELRCNQQDGEGGHVDRERFATLLGEKGA